MASEIDWTSWLLVPAVFLFHEYRPSEQEEDWVRSQRGPCQPTRSAGMMHWFVKIAFVVGLVLYKSNNKGDDHYNIIMSLFLVAYVITMLNTATFLRLRKPNLSAFFSFVVLGATTAIVIILGILASAWWPFGLLLFSTISWTLMEFINKLCFALHHQGDGYGRVPQQPQQQQQLPNVPFISER